MYQNQLQLNHIFSHIHFSMNGNQMYSMQNNLATCATIIEIAHVADEADHRADADIGGVHRIKLGARIERRRLDANRYLMLRWLWLSVNPKSR